MDDTLFPFDAETLAAARISEDGLYRYWLLRRWGPGAAASFIMLNPSTADARVDDPTIRRCAGFARAWGMDALYVVNLYALRSPNPVTLWTADDPVGPENDEWLTRCASDAGKKGWPLIAAWGAHARPDRVAHVVSLPGMAQLTALGVTKAGQPRHPLYLKSNILPRRWPQ